MTVMVKDQLRGARRARTSSGVRLKRGYMAGEFPKDREVPYGKSEAVVEERFTARQLLERSERGLLAPSRDLGYAEEDMTFDMPDMERLGQLDLFEREEMAREYGQRLQDYAARLKEAADLRKAAVEKELEKADPVVSKSKSSKFDEKVVKGKSTSSKDDK